MDESTTVRFGKPWNEMTKTLKEVLIPSTPCTWCQEQFQFEDQGVGIPHLGGEDATYAYYHPNCLLRTIFGSVGHQQKKCSCFGGNLEDPPEMSLREAANAAVAEFNLINRK